MSKYTKLKKIIRYPLSSNDNDKSLFNYEIDPNKDRYLQIFENIKGNNELQCAEKTTLLLKLFNDFQNIDKDMLLYKVDFIQITFKSFPLYRIIQNNSSGRCVYVDLYEYNDIHISKL